MERVAEEEIKKENITQRILQASYKQFLEHGFENTSVDLIAKEAGIDTEIFCSLYSNKEAVLVELIEKLVNHREQLLRSRLPGVQDTRQRLLTIFQSIASLFEDRAELIKVYVNYRKNTYFRNPEGFRLNSLELCIKEVIKKGQETGDIRNDLESIQLLNYLFGIYLIQLSTWSASGNRQRLYDLTSQAVDFFLIGALSTELSQHEIKEYMKIPECEVC